MNRRTADHDEEEIYRYDQEIIKRGANGRALGLSPFDNPFGKVEEMPAKTGETVEVWQLKYKAWAHGWVMENFVRGG